MIIIYNDAPETDGDDGDRTRTKKHTRCTGSWTRRYYITQVYDVAKILTVDRKKSNLYYIMRITISVTCVIDTTSRDTLSCVISQSINNVRILYYVFMYRFHSSPVCIRTTRYYDIIRNQILKN